MISIKRQLQYPFLLSEAWNGVEKDLNKTTIMNKIDKTKFNYKIEDKKSGKNLLHYAAEIKFLGLTNLILNQSLTNSIKPDRNLNLPLDYKKQSFVVSRKMMLRNFRKALRLNHENQNRSFQIEGIQSESGLEGIKSVVHTPGNFTPYFCWSTNREYRFFYF